jgi:hypothetical protein
MPLIISSSRTINDTKLRNLLLISKKTFLPLSSLALALALAVAAQTASFVMHTIQT